MGMAMLLQPLMILCLARSISAFVYSCEEVRYKLINSNMAHNTTYACVYNEEGFKNWDQLGMIHLNNGWSFNSATYCTEKSASDTPWKVTADGSLTLKCDQEFTVVFSSNQPDYSFQRPAKQHYSVVMTSSYDYESSFARMVFVVSQTKMWLHNTGCSGLGTVRVYAGAGIDETEQCYLFRTWTCTSMPRMIYSFDNVITIALEGDISINFEYSSDMGKSGNTPLDQASYGDHLAVLTSGRSDDLQNLKGKTDNRAYINIGTKEDVTVVMDITLDPMNTGSVDLQKKRADKTIYHYYDGVHTEKFNTDYFEVRTHPSDLQPQQISKNQDNVIVDVYIGVDPPPPTTPTPPKTTAMPTTTTKTTTTTTMSTTTATTTTTTTTTTKPTSQASSTKAAPTGSPLTPTGSGYCDCGVDKFGFPTDWDYNGIWLDIVVILDTSEAMGADELDDAAGLIESFIADSDDDIDFLITNTSAPFYTRIGVISMADTATVLYNLNMTRNDKVQGTVAIKKGVIEIDVVEAFDAAVSMLHDGLASQPDRANTRQVVYYMTDSNPRDSNLNQIDQFKATQGVIIVNNFIEDEEIELPALRALASDGYFFSDSNFMVALQAFCKANCFCKEDKKAYGGVDPAIKASGGCYRPAPSGIPFAKAKTTCANEGGILSSIHTDEKGQFVQQLMSDTSSKSDYYWIGYEKNDSGDWQWEDQSSDAYTNWDKGEPLSNSVAKCAYVDSTQSSLPWGASNCAVGFPYICEYAPCSVGNRAC